LAAQAVQLGFVQPLARPARDRQRLLQHRPALLAPPLEEQHLGEKAEIVGLISDTPGRQPVTEPLAQHPRPLLRRAARRQRPPPAPPPAPAARPRGPVAPASQNEKPCSAAIAADASAHASTRRGSRRHWCSIAAKCSASAWLLGCDSSVPSRSAASLCRTASS